MQKYFYFTYIPTNIFLRSPGLSAINKFKNMVDGYCWLPFKQQQRQKIVQCAPLSKSKGGDFFR